MTFRDPRLEAAFERRFHERRLPLDRLHLSTVVACNLALVALKLLPNGRWGTAALQVAEAAAAAGLLAWQRAGTASYLRHRAPLLAFLHTAHALVRRDAARRGSARPVEPSPALVMLARHRCSWLVKRSNCRLQVSMYTQPMSPAPTCDPGSTGGGAAAALHSWVVEALHQLIPWTATFSCVLPLPLK